MRRPPTGLLLAILVYVGLRTVALLLAFDQVGMANYELYPMGTLPKALLLGADIPLQAYYDNAAGQLVTGVLALPLYALFGDGWMILKLVPALCGLGALLCVWGLLDRHASRRAATIGSLAFALGPAELVAKYSLMASGNHFENLFFSLLAVWSFYRLHTAGPQLYRRWLLVAGFTSGLALFVFLGAIIPVGILVGMHLGLRGWRGVGLDLRRGLPAFLIGISPLLLLNFLSSGRGGDFLEAKFGSDKGGAREFGLVVERMREFLLVDLPRAGFHHPFGSEDLRLPNLALVFAFSVAWLAVLPRALRGCAKIARALTGGERPELAELACLPCALFPPLAILAFGISDLRIDTSWPQRLGVAGYRYFLPIFLFATILVAAVSDRWLARGPFARGGGILLLSCLFGSSAWNVAWLRLGTPFVGSHYQGWNFVQGARGLFNSSVQLSHGQRVEIAESLPPVYRAQLYRGIGLNESMRWVANTAREQSVDDFSLIRGGALPLEETVLRYPEGARLHVARGFGTGLRYYVGMQGQSDKNLRLLRDSLEALVASGSPWAYMAVEGAAEVKDFPLPWVDVPRILPRSRRLLELLPPSLRGTYARGLGEVCGRLYVRGIPEEEEFLGEFLHSCYSLGGQPLLEGLGRGMALVDVDPKLMPAARQTVPDALLWGVVERAFESACAGLR